MSTPQRLGLIGSGAVAHALSGAWVAAGREVRVWARRPGAADELAAATGGKLLAVERLADLQGADDLVLAVSDRSIDDVAWQLSRTLEPVSGGVFHTSGATGLGPMHFLTRARWRVGVLHPLLALRASTPVERLRGAAWLVDGDAPAQERGRQLVEDLGGLPLGLGFDAAARLRYHGAATLLASGVASLFAVAEEEFLQAGIAPDAARQGLARLLDSVRANLEELGPGPALTGPLARGDKEVVEAHQRALGPEALALYRGLLGSISRLAGRSE